MLTALLFVAVLCAAELSAAAPGNVLRGKVSCVDCEPGHDLSGIMVLVKCDTVKKLTIATTGRDGSFETELLPASVAPYDHCTAKLTGGPSQLYATKTNMFSEIVGAGDGRGTYTISTPLVFSTACRSVAAEPGKCEFRSSKTVDLPLPPEWGFAPSSYYVPFFPIIGVP